MRGPALPDLPPPPGAGTWIAGHALSLVCAGLLALAAVAVPVLLGVEVSAAVPAAGRLEGAARARLVVGARQAARVRPGDAVRLWPAASRAGGGSTVTGRVVGMEAGEPGSPQVAVVVALDPAAPFPPAEPVAGTIAAAPQPVGRVLWTALRGTGVETEEP